MSHPFKIVLGIVVSILCFWLAVKDVPLGQVGESLAGGRFGWLLLGGGLQVVTLAVRAARWVELLGRKASFEDAFWAQCLGSLVTNILPLRLGEAARVMALATRCSTPVLQIAASAVIERVLDVATVVLILVAILPWMHVPAIVIGAGITFGLAAMTTLLVLFAVAHLSFQVQTAFSFVSRLVPLGWAKSHTSRLNELVPGLSALADRAVIARVAGLSAAIWALSALIFWCALQAFQENSGLLEAAFMLVVLALATAIPSSPGFIGVFQLVGQQSLVMPFEGKYTPAVALAVALGAHFTSYVATTLLGIKGLLHFGGSLAQVATASARLHIGQRTAGPPEA